MKTLNPQDLVEFNINEKAYGQITEEGWKHLNNTVAQDYIEHCIKPKAVELNGEVWYELVLWKWFELFSANIGDEKFCARILFDKQNINSFCL